jgi:cystathionine beta-synthase
MRERQFLDEQSDLNASRILNRKEFKGFLTIEADQSLKEAIRMLKEKGISQMPVTREGEVVGSITEHRILSALLEGPGDADKEVSMIMSDPFPLVDLNTSSKEISSKIHKDNSAVLVKDRRGQLQIITEFDLIQALAG